MKIINWIKNRSGKFALSTAQAVGAAAVVGVAGIAAWQMLSSSGPNQDTVFSSQDPDVVYVAGGAGGSYTGVGYGEGGELQSHINVSKSASQRLMERDFEQEKLRGQNQSSAQYERDEQAISAYQMSGASEGLGVGVGAQEMGAGVSSGGPQGVQDQMAAIAAMAEQKKAEAEAAAAAAGAEGGDVVAAATKVAGLSKGGRDWSAKPNGMAQANGHQLGTDIFGGSTGLAGKGGRVGSSGEIDRLAMGKSGRMQGPSASNFGGYHEKVGNDLGAMAKYAADASGKKMAVNQLASDLYMSGTTGGKGINVNKDSLSLGAGSSPDLDDAMSAVGGALGAFGEAAQTYGEAKEQLQKDILEFKKKCNYIAAFLPVIGSIVAGIMAASSGGIFDKIKEFNKTWGDSEMETENTKGSFGKNARTVVDRIIAGCLLPGGPEWAWVENKDTLYDEKEEEEEEEDKKKKGEEKDK